jgi:ABC-type iron transport system FetAB ATPase subunit
MRLIKRESQLAALHQYAKEASRRQGRFLLISGEAGVGKSVLLQEFAAELPDVRWLWQGVMVYSRPPRLGRCLISPSNKMVNCSGCAVLKRKEISFTAHCYDNLVNCKISRPLRLGMSTGLMRQRWIC